MTMLNLSFFLVNIVVLDYFSYWSHTVGEDEEVSIKYVADTIVKAIGFQGDYMVRYHMSLRYLPFIWHQFDTSRADGQFRKPASNKKLLTLMGGFQFTPFEQGKRPLPF